MRNDVHVYWKVGPRLSESPCRKISGRPLEMGQYKVSQVSVSFHYRLDVGANAFTRCGEFVFVHPGMLASQERCRVLVVVVLARVAIAVHVRCWYQFLKHAVSIVVNAIIPLSSGLRPAYSPPPS